MKYKDDWPQAQHRLDAWWEHRLTGRAIVIATAPREHPAGDIPAPPEPHDLVDRWTNPEILGLNALRNAANTYFAGEAFPQMWVNLGPGIMATYIGSTPTFHEETVWFGEVPHEGIESIADYLEYDPGSVWWQRTQSITRRLLEIAGGELIIGHTDLGGAHDILASMRGTTPLLTDFIDRPEAIKPLAGRIGELWHRYYDELLHIFRAAGQEGTNAWMGIWCRGTWYPLQCDFSAMISPAMFEEHVLPALEYQCGRLDHSIYHWDGPGQIPHLDLLLSIDRLDGIQWTPGAGNPGLESDDWLPLYRRIVDAGKNLVLLGLPIGAVRDLCRKLPPEHLLINTGGTGEREVRDLVAALEK